MMIDLVKALAFLLTFGAGVFFTVAIIDSCYRKGYFPYSKEVIYWFTVYPRLSRLKKLLPDATIFPTGSRVTCNPPTLMTDIDFVIYNPVKVEPQFFVSRGYTLNSNADTNYLGGNHSDTKFEFETYRKGIVNLIVTADSNFAERFQTATFMCTKWNLTDKIQRVITHEAVRGNLSKDWAGTLPDELEKILKNFNSQNGATLHRVFRIQNGLKL